MGAAGTLADQLRIKIGSTEVIHLTAVGALPGTEVTFAAARNGGGVGRLRIDSDGMISWRSPGSTTFGPAIDSSVDDEHLLYDAENRDQWIRLQVWPAYVPAGTEEADVRLCDTYGGVAGDDVSAAEAAAGDVLVTTLTLENVSTFAIPAVSVWIDGNQNSGFRDYFSWLDPQSGNSGVVELSHDNSTWVTPVYEADALELAAIASGSTIPLYVRRTIASGTSSTPKTPVDLRLAFNAI